MKANGTSKPANGGSTDCRGVPVSYGDRGAIEGMEQAHECALSFRGDAIATIDHVLEEHPRFIMGHLFKAGWLTQAMETRVYDEMVAAVAAAEALSSGERPGNEPGRLARKLARRARATAHVRSIVRCGTAREVAVRAPRAVGPDDGVRIRVR